MEAENHYHHYPNALDELESHVTPEQFGYLLSVLSAADVPPESTVITEDPNDSVTSTTWSSSSNDSFSTSTGNTVRFSDKSGRNGKKDAIIPSRQLNTTDHIRQAGMQPVNRTIDQLGVSSNRLILPLSKLSGRPGLLQLTSFDSTLTTANTGGEESSISRHGVTSKDSVLALQKVPLSVEESLVENVQLAQIKYSQLPLPLVLFQGTTEGENVGESGTTVQETYQRSCSRLPVCKRIMGKYMLTNERSLSSSVESVKAETLPDLDNPLSEIAGKIANEPINPFPILKHAPKKSSRMTVGSTSKRTVSRGGGRATLDVHRIEQDIDRELETFQDYKNVSEFFSQRGKHLQNKARKGVSVVNLSRRVTNPLYKVYDPSGYHKSEDELALECIQMVCDDFNKWILSLTDKRKSLEDDKPNAEFEERNVEQHEKSQTIPIIGPEFLIQILRKELELPEALD